MGVSVASAGTSAMDGSPASRYSIEVAGEDGLDLNQHRSRMLDAGMVRDADLIVTMGVGHRQTVGALNADALEYTFLLTNFSDSHHGDIPDPIGGSLEVYRRTRRVIRECIESMAGHLPRLDGYKSGAREGKEGQ